MFFFFKQKTAYEMRISDWSSDVCSSDLRALPPLDAEEISTQDLETMLHEVGRRYLDVIMSPPALALYRTMVAEGLRFPELETAFFESGPGRARESQGAVLKQRRAAWRSAVDDCGPAAQPSPGWTLGHHHPPRD